MECFKNLQRELELVNNRIKIVKILSFFKSKWILAAYWLRIIPLIQFQDIVLHNKSVLCLPETNLQSP